MIEDLHSVEWSGDHAVLPMHIGGSSAGQIRDELSQELERRV